MTDDLNISEESAQRIAEAIAANDPAAKLAAGKQALNQTIRSQGSRHAARSDAIFRRMFGGKAEPGSGRKRPRRIGRDV